MRISREELVRVNNSFHDAIARGSGNRRLIDLIQHNREFYFNYRIAELYNDEEVHASVKGHEAIMGALWDHDGDRAEEITRRHILEGLPIILSRLRLPDGDESGALGFSVASPWQVRQGAP
jgi:DNA-binding GntR family transcriptional regulator